MRSSAAARTRFWNANAKSKEWPASPANLTIQDGDWPAFRGPSRDGIVVGPKISRDWRKQPPREIWRQPVGGGWASFSYANGFLVTIEQRRDQEFVVCYEAATGKEVWKTGWETRFSEDLGMGGDGPRATPTIANGDVFALGAKGRLVCLDGKNGHEKWAVETLDGNKNLQWAMSGSPLVVDNLVIVNPGAQTECRQGTCGPCIRPYDRRRDMGCRQSQGRLFVPRAGFARGDEAGPDL